MAHHTVNTTGTMGRGEGEVVVVEDVAGVNHFSSLMWLGGTFFSLNEEQMDFVIFCCHCPKA